MYIGRIGWAVRLVSKFWTVRYGETHQMMYEIVDLSILQHFWVIDSQGGGIRVSRLNLTQ